MALTNNQMLTFFTLCVVLLASPKIWAESQDPAIDTLAEKVLGQASRPSVFRWREASVIPTIHTRQVLELNLYETSAVELRFNVPSESVLWQWGLAEASTKSTQASNELAKTPYRQPGRPSHWQGHAGVGIPMIEGIGNQYISFIPPLQFVVMVTGDLIYRYYSAGREHQIKRLLQPSLSDEEIGNITRTAPEGMAVDGSRLSLGAGLDLAVFGSWGVMISLGTGVNRGLGRGGLGFVWEHSLGVGYAF